MMAFTLNRVDAEQYELLQADGAARALLTYERHGHAEPYQTPSGRPCWYVHFLRRVNGKRIPVPAGCEKGLVIEADLDAAVAAATTALSR